MYNQIVTDIVMYQRGDRYPGESAEVFVDPKADVYLFCHFAPPFFPSSVFAAFCSAATPPLKNLFISSQLLLRSWY